MPGTFYCTKYALTQGIIEFTGDLSADRKYVSRRQGGSYSGLFCRLGVDAFRTRDDAEARAREMARRKIAALRKNIADLKWLAQTPRWRARGKTERRR